MMRDFAPVLVMLLALVGLLVAFCLVWYGMRDHFEGYCRDMRGQTSQFDGIYVCLDSDGRLLGIFK